MSRAPFQLCPLCVLLLAACGNATPAPAADASAERVGDAPPDARDAAGEAAADDDVPPCAVRPDAAGVACVRQVRGRAVDFAGAALGGHVITYCGPTCYAVTAAADGTFSVEVNDFVAPRNYTLQVHGRPDHASTWVAGVDPVNEVVTFADPIAVPRYQDVGAEITAGAAGGSFAAGDVTLLVPAGARVEFDVEDFELGALGRTLRAVRVEPARAPAFARDAAPRRGVGDGALQPRQRPPPRGPRRQPRRAARRERGRLRGDGQRDRLAPDHWWSARGRRGGPRLGRRRHGCDRPGRGDLLRHMDRGSPQKVGTRSPMKHAPRAALAALVALLGASCDATSPPRGVGADAMADARRRRARHERRPTWRRRTSPSTVDAPRCRRDGRARDAGRPRPP